MVQSDYLAKIPIETIFAILGFAISAGGFVSIFLRDEKKKKIALVAALSALVMLSLITTIRLQQHGRRIARVSGEITEKIGVESKTLDQLYEELYYSGLSDLNEAMDGLIKSGKVGHRILEVRDNHGNEFRVKVFYLRSDPGKR